MAGAWTSTAADRRTDARARSCTSTAVRSGIQGPGMPAACAERGCVSSASAAQGTAAAAPTRPIGCRRGRGCDRSARCPGRGSYRVLAGRVAGPAPAACAPERFPGRAHRWGRSVPGRGPRLVRGHGARERGGVPGHPRRPGEQRPLRGRDWPKWRDVTGAEIAEAFGGLIDDVDRGSLTGEFAEFVAAASRGGAREYWGWVDDDWAFTGDWGSTWAIGVPVHHAGRSRQDGAVRPRRVAVRPHPTACRHLPSTAT